MTQLQHIQLKFKTIHHTNNKIDCGNPYITEKVYKDIII